MSVAGEPVEWGAPNEPCRPSFHQVRVLEIICDTHGIALAECRRIRLEARVRQLEELTDIERLAEAEHEQWMRWAKTLIESEPGLSSERVARWRRLFVPYSQLSEDYKERDRVEARRALEGGGK